MNTIDTPSGLILMAGLYAVAALLYSDTANEIPFRLVGRVVNLGSLSRALGGLTLIAVILNTALPSPIVYPIWIKGVLTPNSMIEHEEWNSISRITVEHEVTNAAPFYWGPSISAPDNALVSYKVLRIDGDAGTPITNLGDGGLASHGYLAYDVTNVAYAAPNIERAAIIGVGGGRDVISAKYFGVNQVTALDVNNVQIDLLSNDPEYSRYAGINSLDGVDLIHHEARSWFRQTDQKFDLIQMSLIDTWAATGAGAFALSENGLYTTDAWSEIIDRLDPGGMFTVSRWSAESQNDTARILSLAMAVLLDRGIENPKSHIFMTSSGTVVTLMIGIDPLSLAQLDALEGRSKEMTFNILLSPRTNAPDGLLGEVSQAKNLRDLRSISRRQEYDISPTSDMRPFFFNQARVNDPVKVIKRVIFDKTRSGVWFGQSKATLNLYLIILFSIGMVVYVIIRPLRFHAAEFEKSYLISSTGYFLFLGLGFMLLEISLLQVLGVFLGHPSYGLGVLLFSLIFFTGLGSFLSERITIESARSGLLWGGMILAYTVVLALQLPEIFRLFGAFNLAGRAAVSVGLMAPLGLLLGYGFPTGFRLANRINPNSTAWLWGVNGAAGVLGSAIAIALNISLGINITLAIGGICYLILSIFMTQLMLKTA